MKPQEVSGLGVALLVLGGFASSTLAVAALSGPGGSPAEAAALLVNVPADQLEAAAPSLYPSLAVATIANAASCTAPLAMILLWKAPGTAPGDTVRIRSGSYLSPPFKIGPAVQRIAIPFPAPYAAGRGVIAVLGEGQNYSVALNPVTRIAGLAGSSAIPVMWQPKLPC